MADVGVKICGLTRAGDAHAAADLGADYLGAILSPGFSRSVEPSLAASFRPGGGARMVGVFVDVPVTRMVRLARTAGVDVIQLHGEEAPETLEALRGEGPWHLWKAVRVRTAGDVRGALGRYGALVDALLLEGWHGGRGGGVGAAFPGGAVESVRDEFPEGLALVVAGGLGPGSVGEAVRRFRPHVVDVSSGVESGVGIKDLGKVEAFIGNAREGGGSNP